MPEAQNWTEPNHPKPLRAVDGKKRSNWREDFDFLDQYYLGALQEKTLDQGKTIRFDVGFLTEVANLIATGKTPYKNFGEFMRDAGVKVFRITAEQLNDPHFVKRAKAMQVYAEAEHRKTIREKNKALLASLAEELTVATTPREIQNVLDACNQARDNMHGTQLQELYSLIGQCEGKFKGMGGT